MDSFLGPSNSQKEENHNNKKGRTWGGCAERKRLAGRLHCPRERNLNDNSSRSTTVTDLRMGRPKAVT